MVTSRPSLAAAEALLLPVFALTAALLLFGVFVWLGGTDPVEAWKLLFLGAFGDAFSWQNTLLRAAPLMLTALAVALPAQAGLTMIGGEGALVFGALACAGLPYLFAPPANTVGSVMVLGAGALMGAAWVMLAGWLRQWRGVNETISSLLLSYIAIALFKHFVEGPMRDPASLNKPSTHPLAEGLRIGPIMGDAAMTSWLGDVHWGLVIGVLACLACGAWLSFSASGFAMRVVGGNARTARLVGLPTDRIILLACALGGGAAGLAGGIEVAAVHTAANASVIAGLGYTGILVSFVARHNPWAIPPVAVLFGGFAAAGSLLQRRLDLPDASVLVLQGFAFVFILAAEALRGRLFAPRAVAKRPAPVAPTATAQGVA
ncbi:ABC transporter permease [Roseateles sp.]|uniref:ABC transporter permease n=1 Tax=Roseateles sp. TaxID=1971397 RepID=UPI003265D982